MGAGGPALLAAAGSARGWPPLGQDKKCSGSTSSGSSSSSRSGGDSSSSGGDSSSSGGDSSSGVPSSLSARSQAASPACSDTTSCSSQDAIQHQGKAAGTTQDAAPPPAGGTQAGAAGAPAAPTAPPHALYSASWYWDGRYAQRATRFDWFYSYPALRLLLRHAATAPALPVLHIGCGNSDVGIGMGEDGTQVINTDISPVVIAQMREDAASWPDGPARRNCSWEVADCRSMPQYGDGAFGMVLDKGTLDAVLCSGTGLGDARAYAAEAHRVLAPGGVLLLISLGQPEARLAMLRATPQLRRPSSAGASAPSQQQQQQQQQQQEPQSAAAAWQHASSAGQPAPGRRDREVRWAHVLVYLLPKPSIYLQGEACLFGRSPGGGAAAAAPGARAVGKDEPVAWLGPFEAGPDLEEILAAPSLDPRDFFFAYACVKPGARPGGRCRRASALAVGPAAAAALGLARAPSLGRSASCGGLVSLGRSQSWGGAARAARPE